MPDRLQRRRTRGWRMPADAVYVGRPTRWGNPFQLHSLSGGLVRYGPGHQQRFGRPWDYEGRISADGNRHDLWYAADDIVETYVRWATRAEVVELFRLTLTAPTPGMVAAYPPAGRLAWCTVAEVRAELAGRDLVCWCPVTDQQGNSVPCHADVLLDLANRPDPIGAP